MLSYAECVVTPGVRLKMVKEYSHYSISFVILFT